MKPSFNTRNADAAIRARKAQRNRGVDTYEERLARDAEWAMSEGSRFFEEKSALQETLKGIAARLAALEINYAVVGGMALFHHGYRRFTEDVDLLATRDGLKAIHQKLEGLGYLPPFDGSKNLRDTEHGVKIEFLVTGEYPGDGKPKPVAFPDPADVAVEKDGIRYVKLPNLIELKLASGITSAERIRDLADVVELIKILNLPASFASSLNPFVQEKYAELWKAAHPSTKRYVRIWRPEYADSLLQAMLAEGVTVDPDRGTSGDSLYLVTLDPAVAKKYDMHDESEFFDADDIAGPAPQ